MKPDRNDSKKKKSNASSGKISSSKIEIVKKGRNKVKYASGKTEKHEGLSIFGSDYFLNYEQSWLKFNWRVLAQAEDPSVPLLERIKFIGIVCSNLDEFYQKRVGGLKRQLLAGVTELSVDGRTPEKQLKEIRKEVLSMIETYRRCYFDKLLPKLALEGIQIITYDKLSSDMKNEAEHYFESQLYPIITPLAVDEAHPFPFISNKSRSLAIKLRNPETNECHFARIKIPANRPRWITLKKRKKERILVSISDIISKKTGRFFPGMEIESVNLFRVTRNADVERNDEEAEDLLELIEDELRERRFAEIVRLEIDTHMPADLKNYLMSNLNIRKKDVFEMDGPIGLADCTQLYDLEGLNQLRYKKWVPVSHPVFRHNINDEKPNIFDVIHKGDFLVHHPYHSFESSTQHFIEEAASDPDVLAIKQTMYRTSSDSPLMHALIRAAEEGNRLQFLLN